jgi:hypothetical protein
VRLLDIDLIYIKPSQNRLRYQVAMRRIVHRLCVLVLAFAVILTGPGGAGRAEGAMLVELCSGDATAAVWINAEGSPVTSNRALGKCLDCLLFSAPLARGPLAMERGVLRQRDLCPDVRSFHVVAALPGHLQAGQIVRVTGLRAIPESAR